jgi:anti-sigma factor RsiW
MNHPTPEEWVPYLYDEGPAEKRRALKAHLDSCPECRGRLAEWRGGLKRLNVWKLPRAQTPGRALAGGALRWAFAALVLLLAGFAAGRFGSERANAAQMRERIEPELKKALLQELAVAARAEANSIAASTARAAEQETGRILATWLQALQVQRTEDQQALQGTLDRLETQRVADLAALKRELDTLALNTDAGLRHTVEGLVQLASLRESPATAPPSTQ